MRWPVSAAVLLALASGGGAAAFDCGKAAKAVEKAICASPALKAGDETMAAEYARVRAASTAAERSMLAIAQRQWIAGREEACAASSGDGLAACIASETDARLGLLRVTPGSGPGTGRPMIPVFVVQEGDARHTAVAFNLARFADPQSPGERLFNARVAEVAATAPLGSHRRDPGGRVYESQSDMAVSYAAPDFISAAVNSAVMEGGAHGMAGISNINVDLRHGRDLAIGGLLDEAAAASLARQCRGQIIAQKQDKADQPYDPAADSFLADSVIAEHVATLSRWTFTAAGAVITFDSYAIGPYSEGTYECSFGMKDLKDIALRSAPLP